MVGRVVRGGLGETEYTGKGRFGDTKFEGMNRTLGSRETDPWRRFSVANVVNPEGTEEAFSCDVRDHPSLVEWVFYVSLETEPRANPKRTLVKLFRTVDSEVVRVNPTGLVPVYLL